MTTVSLVGRRVLLEPFCADDTSFVDGLLNGWDALFLYRQEGVVWTREDLQRRFNDLRTFVIRNVETGDRIGIARIGDHDPLHRRAEMGLYLTEQNRGQRLGLHAGILLLHFCFYYLGLEKVLFQVFATNEASLSVLSKLGFVHEGLLRSHAFRGGVRIDMHLFGLLRQEYDDFERLTELRAEALPQQELRRHRELIANEVEHGR